MTTEKIKVYLCHDHFERLVKGTDFVCDTCPSKAEHRDAVMTMAALADATDRELLTAIQTEIKTLRRGQQYILDDVSKLKTSINGDGNGETGLRSKVMIISDRLNRQSGAAGHWIAIAACVIAIGSVLVSMLK